MRTFYSSGKRLLEEITEYYKGAVSYSLANKLLRKKDVKLNGARVKEDLKTNVGDKIEVYYEPTDTRAKAVIYKDENLMVIYKPTGISSEDFYSLVREENPTAGFIHRLDTNTDGAMVFSLNSISEEELLKGFKDRTFEKVYLAEVYGEPSKKSATLTSYLFKDAKRGEVKIYDQKVVGSERIVTSYSVIKSSGETSLLEVKLITGKTHQIRAHLAHIGHFIIGDGKYGKEVINRKFHANKQRLTSYKLKLFFEESSPLFYLNGKEFQAEPQWMKNK